MKATMRGYADVRGKLWFLLGLLCAGLVPLANAIPPVAPLPAPAFSFDLQSPAVINGFVDAGDVLVIGPGPHPSVLIPRVLLGLMSPLDDLDGLSSTEASLPPGVMFTLLFSVDRESVGQAPPDPALVAAGTPYNVFEQAAHGQAAGDQFMSLTLFTRGERMRGPNNVLTRNNFDEGGTDLQADPPTHAYDNATATAEDNVDGMAELPAGFRNTTIKTYFSVTSQSPSLMILPGSSFPSGAHLFFNPDPLNFAPTNLYAAFFELGLVQADDIDAFIAFDLNQNGLYDAADRVLFSLSRTSPSLLTIPGASPFGAAADVFIATPGEPPALFAPATALGLGDPNDNIDALSLTPCNDPMVCAALRGIRSLTGDLNCDGVVDNFDINPFVMALTNPAQYHLLFPNCNINAADCDHNGVIDNFDINPFVMLLIHG